MKAVKLLGLGVIFTLMFFGLLSIFTETRALKIEEKKLKSELDETRSKNVYLKNRLNYLQNPENVIKELKSELPFKNPDENVIILVKPAPTSSKP